MGRWLWKGGHTIFKQAPFFWGGSDFYHECNMRGVKILRHSNRSLESVNHIIETNLGYLSIAEKKNKLVVLKARVGDRGRNISASW